MLVILSVPGGGKRSVAFGIACELPEIQLTDGRSLRDEEVGFRIAEWRSTPVR